MKWREIQTAPRTGEKILGWVGRGDFKGPKVVHWGVASLMGDYPPTFVSADKSSVWGLTHWMPIPEGPQAGGRAHKWGDK